MAQIAALLPANADRDALRGAAGAHAVSWVRTWKQLAGVVRRTPVVLAVADLHAERRKDGVLRVYRFSQRFPLTPIVVWGDLDGRELFRLGKAGAAEVVLARDGCNAELVGEVLQDQLGEGLADVLDRRLGQRLEPDARALLRFAAERVPEQAQVPDLATGLEVSVSTLERRCERWGLPTPGRVLLWLRVLYGLRWLMESGRSVESVSEQLGYSSGAAFRRAIKTTVGGRPSPLRNDGGFERALLGLASECRVAAAPAGDG
jgi:AraC-like DNA-binding protein